MKITLTQKDLDILEAAYYDEPWHILCGMVQDNFPNIRDLVLRVLTLAKEGFLEINRDPKTTIDANEKDLERIALNREKYGPYDWPEGPTWSVKTTAKGFDFIKDRFE